MIDRLNCLVIGYHDMPFERHTRRVMDREPHSADKRVFMRDQVAEIPNLAAAYLASFLLRHGFFAEFVSLFAAERERITHLLVERSPRIVAITTTFYLMPWPVEEITRFIRRYCPGAVVVVGGPLVNNLVADLNSAALQEILAWADADVYVREAQGEATLAGIVQAVRMGDDLTIIGNCYLRDGGSFRFTGFRPESNSMDENVIDWGLFSTDQLGTVVQTRTARSCAYKCSFCDFHVRAGALSLAGVEVIEQELRQLSERGVQHVVFIDDTFNVPVPLVGQGYEWKHTAMDIAGACDAVDRLMPPNNLEFWIGGGVRDGSGS